MKQELAKPTLQVGLCAYRHKWSRASSTITYSKFLTEYSSGGGGGGMDLAAGTFTATLPGTYSVTFSGTASLNPGEETHIYLHHNSKRLDESQWYSHYHPDNPYFSWEQGSRTLVRSL